MAPIRRSARCTGSRRPPPARARRRRDRRPRSAARGRTRLAAGWFHGDGRLVAGRRAGRRAVGLLRRCHRRRADARDGLFPRRPDPATDDRHRHRLGRDPAAHHPVDPDASRRAADAPLLVSTAVLALAYAVFAESALAFLGFGDPASTSWGTIIHDAFAHAAISAGAWWAVVPPGICLALLIVGCRLLADGIEEELNPRRPALHVSARASRVRLREHPGSAGREPARDPRSPRLVRAARPR